MIELLYIYIYIYIYIVILLYIDLRPGQTCHSKVMHRKEVTHSDGSYEKKSRRRAWLTIWDKVKSYGTLIDWCTGREWPVNCMTVISAWWRSNMPGSQLVGDQMSSRQDVVGKATTRQKGPSGPPVSLETSWWEDAGMRTCPREAGPPDPRLSSLGERERHMAMPGGAGEVHMLQSLFGLQLPLTHKPYNKVRGTFFSKNCVARLIIASKCILHLYMHIYYVSIQQYLRPRVSCFTHLSGRVKG